MSHMSPEQVANLLRAMTHDIAMAAVDGKEPRVLVFNTTDQPIVVGGPAFDKYVGPGCTITVEPGKYLQISEPRST